MNSLALSLLAGSVGASLVACGDDGAASSRADADASPTDLADLAGSDVAPDADASDAVVVPPFGLPPRLLNTSCRLAGEAGGGSPFEARHIVPTLVFDEPADVVFAPGDPTRMYIQERPGRISVVPADDAAATAKVFLDLTDRVVCCAEQGLLGFAFDPAFQANGYFYLYYTADAPRRTVLSRFSIRAGDPDKAVVSSEVVMLEIEQPSTNHHGGLIAFGPDGYLYLAVGDGSGNFDLNEGFGQRRDDLHANILRLDVSRTDVGHPYDVPPDNPFVGVAGVRPEIWAYGFRNPWRFTFDLPTGRMWIGDVQEASFEEIDLGQAGGNYGWSRMEATHCLNPPTGCEEDDTLIRPVLEFPHANGQCAVIAGFVYHGADLPQLEGALLYGDFCTGKVWALRYDGAAVTDNTLVLTTGLNLTAITADPRGEPVLTSLAGGVYRLVARTASGGTDTFPRTLSATGCFRDLATLTPVDGVVPYDLNTPLWSDGTHKRRWIVLPGIATIDFKTTDYWELPVGTILIKQFDLERELGVADSAVPIETRFLSKDADGWHGYSYRWSDDGADAELLDDSLSVTFPVVDPAAPAAPLERAWYYPSRPDCVTCHNAAAGGSLGLQTQQLNREVAYGAVVDNQLRAMEHIGLFGGALPAPPSELPRGPAIDDESAPLEARVKAYFAANCGHCHRPGGPTVAQMDLRWATPWSDAGVLDVAPLRGDLGIPDARIVAPGDPERSVLYRRVSIRGPNQMPPVATALVHEVAVDVIRRWIESLEAP